MTTDHERYLQACDLIGRSQAQTEEALAMLRQLLPGVANPPNRGLINGQIWHCERALGRRDRYFSQSGQDMWLDANVFRGKRGGTFVEVGGHDGFEGSNCLFFELRRGWSGLLIEASPALHAEAARGRRCACVHAAVSGAEGGSARFLEITAGRTQMSGLVSGYGPGELESLTSDPRNVTAIIDVPLRSLAGLLNEHGLHQIDYVSMDIEGAEVAALSTFPFAEFDITAFTIENKARSPELAGLMQKSGYRLVEVIGLDDVYMRTG